MTLKETLIEKGYPIDQMFKQNSDLLVYDTPLVRQVLTDWCMEYGLYKLAWSIPYGGDGFVIQRFIDQTTKKPMLSLFMMWY